MEVSSLLCVMRVRPVITCAGYIVILIIICFIGEEILFGTTDGKIGSVQIGERSAASKWQIDNDKKKGGTLHFTFV